jgi:hypothetical protein
MVRPEAKWNQRKHLGSIEKPITGYGGVLFNNEISTVVLIKLNNFIKMI